MVNIQLKMECDRAQLDQHCPTNSTMALKIVSKKFEPIKSFSSKIFDPQGPYLHKWNKIFLLSCLIAVSLDPLFLYIPIINNDKYCLDLDKKLEATVSILRFFNDLFYLIRIIFQFRTGFIAPSSRALVGGVLVEDAWEITKKYLSSYFLIDILAVLPLPQVVIFVVIPKLNGATMNLLKFVVVMQYIPRVLRVYPLYKQVCRLMGPTEKAWFGNFYVIFLYMLAGHVIGAFWYLISVERQIACWKAACMSQSDCRQASLYCEADHTDTGYTEFLKNSCPVAVPESNVGTFDFGIYLKPVQSGVVGSTDFPQKFFYCLWWGMRNLSSLGQNLNTSTYVWEMCFALFISLSGQMLIAFLIVTKLQIFLQSITLRLEEMRVKKRDIERWMSRRLLPESLRERIRMYEQYKWQVTRGIDEENLIRNLPKDLRRDIKRYLCLPFLKRVPTFEKMDEQLLDAICARLKPMLYIEDSFVVREGDPVDEMLFIMRGKLLTVITNGGRTGFLNSDYLKGGDFCGEELLTWALDPHSSPSDLPISTRTVQALSEVEAFALMAGDWKFIASQFRRLHSKQIRHTFRFYSQQWRTWAACFIQAAWRRYYRKKLEESLLEEENRLQDALINDGGSSPSLGATIYSSRCEANALPLLRAMVRRRRE